MMDLLAVLHAVEVTSFAAGTLILRADQHSISIHILPV